MYNSDKYILVLYINHTFRMCVSKVTFMRRSTMDLVFVQRIFNLVRENTCRKTRYNFRYFLLVRNLQDVVVYQNVIAKES